MHNTQIGIFKIAQTRVNWPEVAEWLRFIGVKDINTILNQISTHSAVREIASGTPVATDASALVALCGKRCYNSYEPGLNKNVSKIRTDHTEYITNVLKSGHGSVLEHASWSFAIENVSRVFTGEMNRHRAGVAISEGSMRYIRFDDMGVTFPDSIVETREDLAQMAEHERNSWYGETDYGPKEATRELFTEAFETMEKWNLELSKIWDIDNIKDFTRKKQLTSMFRRIIGMGISTGGVWTLNARALNHVLHMRCSEHAEEEICHVFDRIADIMIADEPLLFGHLHKNEKGFWESGYPKI